MMLNKFMLISASLVLTVAIACAGKSAPEKAVTTDTPILKVAVLANGRITVDGRVATIDSLRDSLKRLAEQGGAVWYYREQAQSEPPPQAMAVIQAIIDKGLPVRLSTKPDYSDTVGADGRPVR